MNKHSTLKDSLTDAQIHNYNILSATVDKVM